MSDSLRPHGLQHARPPCPLPTPGVYSNSCPSSQWCHPIISASIISFSSCLQSFPASGSFQMPVLLNRWPEYWSFRFSISPFNEHSVLISFRMERLDLVGSPCCPRDSQESSPIPQCKSILWHSACFIVQLPHPYMTTGKTITFTIWTFVSK